MDEDLIIPSDFQWPAPQGVGSATFTPPPIDGTLLLFEMAEYNRVHSPCHPVWEYPALDEPGKVEVITWKQYGGAMHAAAHIIAAEVPVSDGTRRTLGILSTVNQPTFMAMELGILLTGHVPFLISPRNSLAAVIHLLKATSTTHLIVDTGNAMYVNLATEAVQAIAAETGLSIPILPTPTFEALYKAPCFRPFVPTVKLGLRDVGAILHSSGSTAHPKPINTSHAMLLEFSRLFWFGDTDMCGKRENGMVLPSFHNYAVVQILCKTIASGKINCTANPYLPTSIPTATQALRDIVASNCFTLLMIPAFISEWSRDPDAIAELSKFKAVFTGGAPTSVEVGKAMVDGGVRLVNLYGSTECGISSRLLITRSLGYEWEWIEKVGAMRWHLTSEGDGTYEVHVMQHRLCNPGVINFTLPDGSKGFSTSDLVAPHPTNPNLWRIVGRKDEQILLLNGEKTNPLPSEGIVNKDVLVQDSMMFGAGRTQNGILVLPRGAAVDPSDAVAVSAFRNAIWPSVEKANENAPQHSRIFKEMILVASRAKPFDYTPKMSLRRKVVLKLYDAEIDALYAAKDASTLDVAGPASWRQPADVVEFVRRVVHEVARGGRRIADEDSLFEHGFDSLQATYCRNTIISALRVADIDTSKIPMNVVYLYPSIVSLANYLSQVAANKVESESRETSIHRMEELAAKYSRKFPTHIPSAASASTAAESVVLLTGSTGALGSYILALLLEDPSVVTIYALNRKGPRSTLAERQSAAFADRGLPVSLLESPALRLVEAAEQSPMPLGLPSELYDEIRTRVTTVIHNAWRLDFNLPLAQFEPQIASVRQLVDLALGSPLARPPLFIFTSSVGAVSGWDGNERVPERHLESFSSAVGMGYGSSKAVAEKILENASRETALQTITVRIGQLCGSTLNGAWNPTDWVPLLLQSAAFVGCLPSLPQVVTWTPIDVAAQVLLDFRTSAPKLDHDAVLHVVSPRPTPWDTLFEVFSTAHGARLVPYGEWLAKVEASSDANPAQKLLGFFRRGALAKGQDPATREATGIPLFSTARSVAASTTLRDLPSLSVGDARRWLRYWAEAKCSS